eukprot:TRINITY_DN140_c0_g1_i11.p3 TRINITY_DN140_c0_g1~~TRINITY_DN140_c0_g1_i11.p3  ORF type:complete len:173 (+),score=32.02 TRINITY_DN140_c0_g1_i11:53-571(+)
MHVVHNDAAVMDLCSSKTTADTAFAVGCVSDSDDACSSMQGTLPHSRSGTPTIDSPHAHQLRHCWERSMCELCQGQSRCRSAPMWCEACQCIMCDDCASSCGCRSELHGGGDCSDGGPSNGPQHTTEEALPVLSKIMDHKPHPAFSIRPVKAKRKSRGRGGGRQTALVRAGR